MATRRRLGGLLTNKLDDLARDHVGDGKGLNHYFVTDNGHVVTVSEDFQTAYDHWRKLAARRPLMECALEDRLTGVLADVSPHEEDGGRLLISDDTDRFVKKA